MDIRKYGITRRELRGGAGRGQDIASEHFHEMIGSTVLYIYRHPNRKIKGYGALKEYLESQEAEVVHVVDAQTPAGQSYETIRITSKGEQIPLHLLRRSHNWAHQRNLLHMFHKRE